MNMKSIMLILLGVFITISFAAGVSGGDFITIKPATPKSTVILKGYPKELQDDSTKYLQQGYIIKDVSVAMNTGIMILEKY